MGVGGGRQAAAPSRSLDPEEEPFWRFSWDHMGTYDLPAMLDMVSLRWR